MHQHKTDTKTPSKLLIIYVAVILALIVIFHKEIQAIAPTFQLTPAELKMIPIGALLFILFWRVAHHFIFVPYIKLFEAREAATTGSLEESKKFADQAEQLTNQVTAQLFEARSKQAREREQVLAETKKTCDFEASKAASSLQVQLAEARTKNSQEISALKSSLDNQVEGLTREVVDRIKNCQQTPTAGAQ